MSEPLKTLADAIAAGELTETDCNGFEHRGVWRHACPKCTHLKPAFALVDVRAIDPLIGFMCDGCYSHIDRHLRAMFSPPPPDEPADDAAA